MIPGKNILSLVKLSAYRSADSFIMKSTREDSIKISIFDLVHGDLSVDVGTVWSSVYMKCIDETR